LRTCARQEFSTFGTTMSRFGWSMTGRHTRCVLQHDTYIAFCDYFTIYQTTAPFSGKTLESRQFLTKVLHIRKVRAIPIQPTNYHSLSPLSAGLPLWSIQYSDPNSEFQRGQSQRHWRCPSRWSMSNEFDTSIVYFLLAKLMGI
jgi:hypothetical protein